MIAETVAGRVTYLLLPAFPRPQLRDGTLIALAVTSARRSNLLPEITTVAELGLVGFDFTEWYGMWAPASTPTDIVEKIGKDVARALADPTLLTPLSDMRVEPMIMAPAEFESFARNEAESVARIVKASGITLQ